MLHKLYYLLWRHLKAPYYHHIVLSLELRECSQFKCTPSQKKWRGVENFQRPLFSWNFQRPPFFGVKVFRDFPLKKINTFKTSLYNEYMPLKHIYFFIPGHLHRSFRRPPFFLLKFSKTPLFGVKIFEDSPTDFSGGTLRLWILLKGVYRARRNHGFYTSCAL